MAKAWRRTPTHEMTDAHLVNSYKSLKRRTYRDGNRAVLQFNIDWLTEYADEMKRRGIPLPHAEFRTGWLWTQITPEGDSIYDDF